MTQQLNSPLLLFYPTSPVHVRDIRQVAGKLSGWRCSAVVYLPLARVAPGISAALSDQEIDSIEIDQEWEFEKQLPNDPAILALGAVFEPFALDLFAWAKLRHIPVIAFQEVAQLALNQYDINNYDAPFDRLFVASPDEHRRFVDLGYPSEMLSVSGLLANDHFAADETLRADEMLIKLGITDRKKPIVYTTSPIRGRLSLHNNDDLQFREAVLTQMAVASRKTGRKAVIKLHPNENIETAQDHIRKFIPEAIVLGRQVSMDEIFPGIGVLVNRGNSQTCLDAVLRGIPTVVVACGLKTLFHKDGGAYVVDEVSELSGTIERACNQGPVDASRVKAKHFFLPPEGVTAFIAKELSSLVSSTPPATKNTWNWLIKSMLFVGRHDRALALCKTLQTRSPWQAFVHDALQAHSEARIENSIACWLECATVDPNWYFPHYELAHGFQATGEFEQAIAHAHKAIELHPPFHSLWHEIPMRVVIMASLRRKDELTAASMELKLLKERGLVEVVPELLIEAAAQHCAFSDKLEAAERCLEKAFEQLKLYPVDQVRDSHILDRSVRQYVDLAERYAETGDSARFATCLTRAVECAHSDAAVLNRLGSHLGKLGEKRETAVDYLLAEKCYALAIQADPTAHWLRYGQSRMALKQRKIRETFQGLFTIARIPNAPRAIIEKILSPEGGARLAPYWPASPKSIVKPLTLSLFMSGWFFGRLASSPLRDLHTSITAVILVWLFVTRHFVRRLRTESSSIRKLFYRIRSFLTSPFPSRGDRVTNCPICRARGKFEYQNKQTPLLRCLDCDHVWARDLPDDQALSALYGDFGYWERDRYHQGITAIQESEQWQVYLDARIGILRKLKLLDNSPRSTKTVFEIGCAEGMLLHELRKRGMEVMGCEMNRAVATEGMKALGIDILTAPFETIELPANNFDLVMSFHTLEHLRDPGSVLARVANILRPDGAVLLEVPCGEEEYENTDHLHFFSDTSLATLLNKFFRTTDILDNSYTNSAGVRIGSIYGLGKGVKN
jgi:tetratricopeptide (TPR) repeat protein/SAM-dependent methyltransferase